MIDVDAVDRIIGADAVDPDGSHLGRVVEIYLDDDTGQPEWALVRSDLLGPGTTCVPLSRAELMGTSLRVPFDRSVFASAPTVRGGESHLSREGESELRRHYGLTTAAAPGDGGVARTGDVRAEQPARAPHGARPDVIRSEERLRTSTEWVPTERVRIRKVVVTEDVTVTVTLAREELRVERETLTSGTSAEVSSDRAREDEPHVIVLRAERPLVSTEVVATELVRLSTVLVGGSETVSDTVRVERIEATNEVTPEAGTLSGDRLRPGSDVD